MARRDFPVDRAKLGDFWSRRVTRRPRRSDAGGWRRSRWARRACCGWGCWGAGSAGPAPVGVGAAWSAGIMVGRVITEDRAGVRAPGVPGSRSSSWSWSIARVTRHESFRAVSSPLKVLARAP